MRETSRAVSGSASGSKGDTLARAVLRLLRDCDPELQPYLKVWDKVSEADRGGAGFDKFFHKLPDMKMLPGYRDVVAEPTDLLTVKQRLLSGELRSVQAPVQQFDFLNFG